MGDEVQELEDDIFSQFDFENLFGNISDCVDLFGDDLPLVTESSIHDSIQENSNPSPDSVSSWMGEIEQILMKDDKEVEEENQEYCEGFFSDLILDVPVDQSGEVRVSNDEKSMPESNDSDDSEEKERSDVSEVKSGEDQDPISKKRKRQLRNRDAAVRSRERKKIYVTDLEMKSRYLEGECRRLERLLQCCVAENHALHLRLQKDKAISASMAKQESAVLLLESLLLGSLLWFLGIMCLFSLPGLLRQTQPAQVRLKVGGKGQEIAALGGARNERVGLGALRLFFKSKRCKASRSKIKIVPFFHAVFA